MKNFKNILLFTMVALGACASQAREFSTVHGRKAQVDILDRLVVMTSLPDVVKEMEKTGVHIYRVPQEKKLNKPENFQFLPEVPEKLKEKIPSEVNDTQDEAAIFVSWNDIGTEKDGNVLLVAEYAHPVTLFHEFTHHLFEINNRKDTLKITEDQNKYNSTLSTFNFRMGKVLFDRSLLLNPLWRRDIDNAIQDSLALADAVQSRAIEEEVAVEVGLLDVMTEKKSPWFTIARAKEGIEGYAQGLVTMSFNRMDSILGLMDIVKTDGEEMDPSCTQEEIQKREQLYGPIREKINHYIQTELTDIQKVVTAADEKLKSIEASAK